MVASSDLFANQPPSRFIICGSNHNDLGTLIGQLRNESKWCLEEPNTSGHWMPDAAKVDLVIILTDAHTGMAAPIRRNIYLAHLAGIRQVVVAVDQMELVDYSKEVFGRIKEQCFGFLQEFGIANITVLPISSAKGFNIVEGSRNTPWYQSPTLLHHQEAADLERRVQATRLESTVTRIGSTHNESDPSDARQRVSLTRTDLANRFQATVVWLHDAPLLRSREYRMKVGTRTVVASVQRLRHHLNTSTREKAAIEKLEFDEIGVVELELDQPIEYSTCSRNRDMCGFTLVDQLTNTTVGAGMLDFALRRADNIHWQALDVNKQARRTLNGHGSGVIWLTGLSGAGKSTIANLLEKKFYAAGLRTYLLDGDNVRHGLNKDLGFTAEDRVENIRRVAEVARLMVDAGIVVITAFISPFRAERDMARNMFGKNEFCEVYVRTPLEVAEQRDVKGLYKKARSGLLKNFTGIDSPYEEPLGPDILIESAVTSADMAAHQVYEYVVRFISEARRSPT
ncbi:adenylyl-sulfate kinase [Sphaerotilus sp.]|uniref:adenylyl-sulfate kinase n=1 Tax=Sphaerotilus sp. TaxID=2093942 RepID=UPI00286E860D|nr:adenylyl-sulfate kinase [Sphaerotilus sp.]